MISAGCQWPEQHLETTPNKDTTLSHLSHTKMSEIFNLGYSPRFIHHRTTVDKNIYGNIPHIISQSVKNKFYNTK